MMNEGNRNRSRVEFDNAYFAIDDDIERLISTNFGVSGEELERNRGYLKRKADALSELSQALYMHLKIANGIYPSSRTELEERRTHQKYAAGACYGIVTLYERIFHHLNISREKHIEEIKHVKKELNSIKSWKESDNKRFKY